jgi:hypothetical protein
MASKIAYRNAALKATKQTVFNVPEGMVSFWHIYNQDAVVTYLQLYDALAAGVTVGTTTPTFTLAVPASGWLDNVSDQGILQFANGLVIAATTTIAGLTDPTNGLLVNIGWR